MREVLSCQEELSRRTFRNLCGYLLFAACVIVPAISDWKSGAPVMAPAVGQPGIGNPSQFPGNRQQPGGVLSDSGDVRARLAKWIWWLTRAMFASIGTTIAMVVLLPYRGCKRFALLFGAPTGLAAMIATGVWLSGRTVVYRAEIVVIAIVAALPTGFLWMKCCEWSRSRRLADADYDADYEDE